MSTLEDNRPIRIPYFGVFTIRQHKGKDKIQLMILLKFAEELMRQYDSKELDVTFKPAIKHVIETMINLLIEKGYKDEQFVQYLIDWKDRN